MQTERTSRGCIGFLNVYKPKGITSHDVVAQVRKILKIKHVGHGGTLDPLAEGVLPLAVGSACRLFRFLSHDKVYVAEVLLGRRTTTDDILGEALQDLDDNVENVPSAAVIAGGADGDATLPARMPSVERRDGQVPSVDQILTALSQFRGKIKQRPPMYSALHKDGKRLYELARQGKIVELDEREVEVFAIEILSYAYPSLRLRVACGGGTYIRSIARDLGEKLGCGGCLQSLIRQQSGPFILSDALDLESYGDQQRLLESIRAPQEVLENDKGTVVLKLDHSQQKAITCGQKLAFQELVKGLQNASAILASYNGELVAVCTLTEDGKIKPEVVLSHAE